MTHTYSIIQKVINMTTKTEYVKLELLVKGEVVFAYVRSGDQFDMSDVEVRLVNDRVGE
jgi:hypothetical protein